GLVASGDASIMIRPGLRSGPRQWTVISAVLMAFVVGVGGGAAAQGFSVDLSAGKIVYDPAAVGLDTNSLFATLRYDARHDAWVYGSAAAPLGSEDTFWGAIGAGGRFVAPAARGSHAALGIDLAAEGFHFRDAITEQSGNGGTIEAMP